MYTLIFLLSITFSVLRAKYHHPHAIEPGTKPTTVAPDNYRTFNRPYLRMYPNSSATYGKIIFYRNYELFTPTLL